MHRKKKHSRSKYTSDRKLLRILVFLNFICKPHDKPFFIHENLVKRYLREGEGGTELRGLQQRAAGVPPGRPEGGREDTQRERSRPHSQGHTPWHLLVFYYFATFLCPLPDGRGVFGVKYEHLKHTSICKPGLHLI